MAKSKGLETGPGNARSVDVCRSGVGEWVGRDVSWENVDVDALVPGVAREDVGDASPSCRRSLTDEILPKWEGSRSRVA